LDLLEEFLVRQRRSAGHAPLSWAFDVSQILSGDWRMVKTTA